jgi:hypothetical protein
MARTQGERLLTMEEPASRKAGGPDLAVYQYGPLRFTDAEDVYDRQVAFDHAVSLESPDERERFQAVARPLRDLLTQRWLLTEQAYARFNPASGSASITSDQFCRGSERRLSRTKLPDAEIDDVVNERAADEKLHQIPRYWAHTAPTAWPRSIRNWSARRSDRRTRTPTVGCARP